ncbi:MAG: FecR domain-containing protein, partial [Fuerstiella sp.]|nr:FecR domain-containing protein [Fuerstiella sp.]
MSDLNLEELIDRHLRGELHDSEKERLTELLDSDPSARKTFVQHAEWDTRFAEALREERHDRGLPDILNRPAKERSTIFRLRTLLTLAATAIIALAAGLYFNQPSMEPAVAKITGVNGSQLWTFDGGSIVRDLSIGTSLFGGTVEGVTPDSWVELEFGDGSVVTISGISMLTFSDNGQKTLHLKEGTFSGSVQPQPAGRPMLVHTRTATFEVLGTQFNVDADPFAATLSVSKGSVRAKRLSDGNTIDVPAAHRVTAAPDREMKLVQVPDSVSQWRTQLHRGPDRSHGRWSRKSDQKEATLGTVPYTTEDGKVIYTAGFGVARGDSPPVVLRTDSMIRVRGLITSPHSVWFGMEVRHTNGDFAGRFQTVRPAKDFQSDKELEVLLKLRD